MCTRKGRRTWLPQDTDARARSWCAPQWIQVRTVRRQVGPGDHMLEKDEGGREKRERESRTGKNEQCRTERHSETRAEGPPQSLRLYATMRRLTDYASVLVPPAFCSYSAPSRAPLSLSIVSALMVTGNMDMDPDMDMWV